MKIYKLNYKSLYKSTICPIDRARVTRKGVEERQTMRCKSFKSCFWQPFRHVVTDHYKPKQKTIEYKIFGPVISLLGQQSFYINLLSLAYWSINMSFLVLSIDVHFFNWIISTQRVVMMFFYWICLHPNPWLCLVHHVRLGLFKCQQVK